MQSISQNQPNRHEFGKVFNQFNLGRPRVIYGGQKIISTIQKNARRSYLHQHSEDQADSHLPQLALFGVSSIKSPTALFLQSMHDFSTLQTIKKIPRKITYPLKRSRYKENTIYIHLAKILIIKPLTASFHGAINSFASKLIISTLLVSLCHFMTVRESQ
ncbi:hypothetical protein F2Q68_00008360 [Brassica cretica]|uniref:Uncharacterized protein n=1 Tax=Brassica cretica TaxID=69181 RepID=A0A8S9KN32_BRACR|nr:hypothetical protein F2Q68_00008360 [Brassica cretica]